MSDSTLNDSKAGSKGDESTLWGLEKDNEWRNAYRRIISYAWISQDNLKEVVDNPLDCLLKISGYVPPQGLILYFRGIYNNKVIKSPEQQIDDDVYVKCSYDSKYMKDKMAINGWNDAEKSLPTEVTFTLPPAPAESDLRAFALADFEAKGKEMPFSCC